VTGGVIISVMSEQTSISDARISELQTSQETISDAKERGILGNRPSPAMSENGVLEKEDLLMDHALDTLLLRARTPHLGCGFADRVIQSVQPGGRTCWRSQSVRLASLAAALAVCVGSLLWNHPRSNSQLRPSVTIDEESLVAALRSPGLSGEDLALVAKLGEVLEAELIANHPVWLDEK
jgi:hypothetical protein